MVGSWPLSRGLGSGPVLSSFRQRHAVKETSHSKLIRVLIGANIGSNPSTCEASIHPIRYRINNFQRF